MGKILFYGLSSKMGSLCLQSPNKKILKNFQNQIVTTACSNGLASLSANQIGSFINMFTVLKKQHLIDNKWSGYTKTKQTYYAIYCNPQIINYSVKKLQSWQQCSSYPGIKMLIERSNTIKISYRDSRQTQCISQQNGMLSRILQHEYDHLTGVDLLKKCRQIAVESQELQNKHSQQINTLLLNFHKDINIDKQNFYSSSNFKKLKQLITYSIIDKYS